MFRRAFSSAPIYDLSTHDKLMRAAKSKMPLFSTNRVEGVCYGYVGATLESYLLAGANKDHGSTTCSVTPGIVLKSYLLADMEATVSFLLTSATIPSSPAERNNKYQQQQNLLSKIIIHQIPRAFPKDFKENQQVNHQDIQSSQTIAGSEALKKQKGLVSVLFITEFKNHISLIDQLTQLEPFLKATIGTVAIQLDSANHSTFLAYTPEGWLFMDSNKIQIPDPSPKTNDLAKKILCAHNFEDSGPEITFRFFCLGSQCADVLKAMENYTFISHIGQADQDNQKIQANQEYHHSQRPSRVLQSSSSGSSSQPEIAQSAYTLYSSGLFHAKSDHKAFSKVLENGQLLAVKQLVTAKHSGVYLPHAISKAKEFHHTRIALFLTLWRGSEYLRRGNTQDVFEFIHAIITQVKKDWENSSLFGKPFFSNHADFLQREDFPILRKVTDQLMDQLKNRDNGAENKTQPTLADALVDLAYAHYPEERPCYLDADIEKKAPQHPNCNR